MALVEERERVQFGTAVWAILHGRGWASRALDVQTPNLVVATLIAVSFLQSSISHAKTYVGSS